MRKSLITVWITVTAIAFSATATAQATFETLMTHSVSTAVGTHAGTALGRATNALANHVAAQTSSATTRTSVAPRRTATPSHAVTAKPVVLGTRDHASSQSASAKASGDGSLIASIQGGERPRAASICAPSTKAADGKVADQSCGAQPSTDAHPSVVNLPAPQ